MKKRFMVIIITLLSVFIITGCGTRKENNENTSNNTKTNKKVAVLYFSATGNTKEVAESIKDLTDGELIEIVPLKEYTSADLNYNDGNTRATKEQNDSSSRPEIKNTINVDYDVIYLGYPIWWGDVPHIILTFIDTYDLDGKTVIPFCTSGSSSIDSSLNTLKNYNKNINWVDGKRLTNNKKEIENWINSLNY